MSDIKVEDVVEMPPAPNLTRYPPTDQQPLPSVVKPIKKEKTKTSLFRPLVITFLLFGFDLKVRSNRVTKTVLLIVCILIRILFVYVIHLTYEVTMSCAKVQSKILIRAQCQPIVFRVTAVDLAFGLLCFLALCVQERKARSLFDRVTGEAFDALPILTANEAAWKKKASRRQAILSVLFVLLAVSAAFWANVGLGSIASALSMAFTSWRGKMNVAKTVMRDFPIRVLCTLYCILYAAACFLASVYVQRMAKMTTEHVTSDQFATMEAKLRLLIKSINASFGGFLPFLYVSRIVALALWAEYFWNNTAFGIDIRLSAVALHVFQFGCLVWPPLFVNDQLMSFEVRVSGRRDRRDITYGSSSRFFRPVGDGGDCSPVVHSLSSEPPKLTAGGSTITVWTVVKAVEVLLVILWMEFKINSLMKRK